MMGMHQMPDGGMMANDQMGMPMPQEQGNPLLALLGMGGQSAQPQISPIELLKMLLMMQRQEDAAQAPQVAPGVGPAMQQMMMPQAPPSGQPMPSASPY